MAYFDHAQAAYDNSCKEEYEKLKENLRKSKNETDEKIWKYMMALEHDAKIAEERITVYEKFFETLRFLLPKEHSIHDVIG